MPASFRYLTDTRFRLNSLLAKWRDGRYYTAHVVKSNKESKKCLVCFEDGSEHWLQSRDIHVQLSYDNIDLDEDLVCSMCDDGKSEAPNEIVLCDVCQQGYHQKCHIPPVEDSKLDESESDKHQDWMCSTCYYILNQSRTLGSSTSMVSAGPSPSNNNNISIKKDNNLVNIRSGSSSNNSNNNNSSNSGSNKTSINNNNISKSIPAPSTSFQISDGSSSDDALEIVTKSKTSEKKGRTKPTTTIANQKVSPPKAQPSRSPVKHAVRKSATNHTIPDQAPQQQQQHVSVKSNSKDSITVQIPNKDSNSSATTETKTTTTTTTSTTSSSSNRLAIKTKSITAIADNLRIVSKKPKLVKTQPPIPATGAISSSGSANAASGTIVVVPTTSMSSTTSTKSINSASNNNLAPQNNKSEESRLHLAPATCQAQQQSPILNQNKQQQQVVSEQSSNTPSREASIIENVVDQLIPRPGNFEGDNNPFVGLP